MKGIKSKAPRKKVDHSRTNRNAIITAIILTFIIISAATTGLIIIQSQTSPVVQSKEATQNIGSEKNRSKFFLKLYDYIARSQTELHSTLDKI